MGAIPKLIHGVLFFVCLSGELSVAAETGRPYYCVRELVNAFTTDCVSHIVLVSEPTGKTIETFKLTKQLSVIMTNEGLYLRKSRRRKITFHELLSLKHGDTLMPYFGKEDLNGLQKIAPKILMVAVVNDWHVVVITPEEIYAGALLVGPYSIPQWDATGVIPSVRFGEHVCTSCEGKANYTLPGGFVDETVQLNDRPYCRVCFNELTGAVSLNTRSDNRTQFGTLRGTGHTEGQRHGNKKIK